MAFFIVINLLAVLSTAVYLVHWTGVINVRLNEIEQRHAEHLERVLESIPSCKFYPQELPTIKEVHKVVETSTAAEFMSSQYKRVNDKYKSQ